VEQYAVVLIKPDSIRDVLEEIILQNLQEEAKVIPVFRKLWKITENLAKIIYPSWVKRPEFPAMVYNITQGMSFFTVVCGDEDIYESLTRVKGKMNQGGLRLRYRTYSIEEWQSFGYSGKDLQNKIAENRLHTTDNLEETISLCSLAMNYYDLVQIELIAPSLVAAIRRKRAIQLRAAL
jgi:nucleoside diphosphate kinase